jgi:hypothetical protein
MRLNEHFDLKDSQIGDSILLVEEDLLRMLTNYSAIDILQSEDVTNQLIQLSQAVPLNT